MESFLGNPLYHSPQITVQLSDKTFTGNRVQVWKKGKKGKNGVAIKCYVYVFKMILRNINVALDSIVGLIKTELRTAFKSCHIS